jgi:hypothetical protein
MITITVLLVILLGFHQIITLTVKLVILLASIR